MKRNCHLVASALPVGQEPNASGDEVYMRRLRIRQFYVQTVVKQDTTRELVLQKTKDKALPIKQSNDTNIEEATDELLRIQEENEEDDNATKNERSTTCKTESLSVP